MMSRRLPWSISTTVRNPARLRDFLLVLERFQGRPFDSQTQKEYQIALIQERLYQPSQIPESLKLRYHDYEQPLSWEDAKCIFEMKKYVDPAMRGRQSVNPLNKLGLAIALQRMGEVRITAAGQRLVANETTASEVIFSALLKLQYPNPLNKDFSASRGFNIIPMIAVMRLLEHLRSKGKHGLTREEFCFFIPTWLDTSDLQNQAERIVEYARLQQGSKQGYLLEWLHEFYGEPVSNKDTRYKNLYDYGDNAMRYFRFTKYFSITFATPAGGWIIDVEPTRRREVEMLIQEMDGNAKPFGSLEEYLSYLGDPLQPPLPWKRESELCQIIVDLQTRVQTLVPEGVSDDYQRSMLTPPDGLTLPQLEQRADDLRKLIRELTIRVRQSQIRWNLQAIEALRGDLLNARKNLTEPAALEKLIFDILAAFDDELAITPNYPMDDTGNPISHASGNRADIECSYNQFRMIVEVTLDSGRHQWVREGQPVMRHLRDFEQRFPDSEVFCLFLAPRIHQDTYSQFWFAVRYEYGGQPQKIVPLSFDQLADVMQAVANYIQKHQQFSHQLLYELLQQANDGLDKLSGYHKWREHIQSVIDKWCQRVRQ